MGKDQNITRQYSAHNELYLHIPIIEFAFLSLLPSFLLIPHPNYTHTAAFIIPSPLSWQPAWVQWRLRQHGTWLLMDSRCFLEKYRPMIWFQPAIFCVLWRPLNPNSFRSTLLPCSQDYHQSLHFFLQLIFLLPFPLSVPSLLPV